MNATPEEVFGYVAGGGSDHEWRSPVVRSVRVGARYRTKLEIMGLPQTVVNEVTAYEPPRLLEWIQVPKAPVVTRVGSYRLEPANGRTRFTLAVEYEGRGAGKLFEPLTAWYVRTRLLDRFPGQLKSQVEQRA